jgi:hypothetical protein
MTGAAGELVIGFHPTPRGFGWVVFEGPDVLIDWGLAYARSDAHATCLRHLRTILARHRPERLVLEQFEGQALRRSRTTRELCLAIVRMADRFSITVSRYDRQEIALALANSPWASRHRVAEAIAERAPMLRHRMPPMRRPWDSLDRRMGLFSAAAVALTHFERESAR